MDKNLTVIPVSAIIPTANRVEVLSNMLSSLALQSCLPAEIIIIDASDNKKTEDLAILMQSRIPNIYYLKATDKGAAAQRNQGIEIANNPFIFFMDDDIIFEKDCVYILWKAMRDNENAGGVSAMITNQKYHPPGFFTSFMYCLMNGKKLNTYAGKCIGPAWNLLPEDKHDLPGIVPVEWLNTTCTLYRKEALPSIVFDSHFTGYSLMEDLALSLRVSKFWNIYNARNARIFHNSQPGSHKRSVSKIAHMELINRWYVMVVILNRRSFTEFCKLIIFELFGILSSLNSLQGWRYLMPCLVGKTAALFKIISRKYNKT